MKHVFRFANRSRSALLTMLAFVIVGGFLFIPSAEAEGSLPCGTIYGPVYITGYTADESKLVEDCDDPFEILENIESSVGLKINGVTIQNNITLTLKDGVVDSLEVLDVPQDAFSYPLFYRHDGNDYRLYEIYPVSSEGGLQDYLESYEVDEVSRELYAEAIPLLFAGETVDPVFVDSEENPIVNEITGETYRDEFFAFVGEYENDVQNQPVAIPEGTYTVVLDVGYIFLTYDRSWWENIKDLFITHTAHAQIVEDVFKDTRRTITFTVVHEEDVPTGASSILFLPGILGSELYEESDECALFGSEQRRWVSFSACEQRRLKTDFLGNSINDIYTHPGTDAIVSDVLAISNLYESFLEDLEDWKEDDIISDFAAIPYDWRLSLDAIIKTKLINGKLVAGEASTIQEGYLYQILTDLVDTSKSSKVTMVTHSNGGLVAKYFLHALEVADDPLLDKVDNLILVGVPQVGTSDAIAALLHGSEIGFEGFVISQQVVRELSNTAPFAHHLLPHEAYFDAVDTPVIQILEGTSTAALTAKYGSHVDSYDELHEFLVKDNGRPKPAADDLKTPEVVDQALLNYANIAGIALADFDIPDTLTVHQVAGTGFSTASALEYYTSRVCASYTSDARCLVYAPQLDFRVIDTIDGDQTVVTPSALALRESEAKKWWVDLDLYDNLLNKKRIHKDIFEIPDIRTFVKDVVEGIKTVEYEYIFDDVSDITRQDGPRLVFQLHSPLDLSVVTQSGGMVSSSTNTVPGASYQRFGELQFISLPEEEGVEVLLTGVGSGSFSLDLERKEGDERMEIVTLSGIPTATSTRASVILGEGKSLSEAALMVDFDGNGTTDVVHTQAEVTYTASGPTGTTTPPMVEVPRRSGGGGGGGTTLRESIPMGTVAGVQTLSREELLRSLYLKLIPLLQQYYQILLKI